MVKHTEAFLEKQRLRNLEREEERKRKKEEGFNKGLREARKEKNDEFYTRYSDVEDELSNYSWQFCGKTVLCNCNDTVHNAFKEYFRDNFTKLGLECLICTGYKTTDGHGDLYVYDGKNEKYSILEGDGSFSSDECVEWLKQSDIVVTNVPFSLFREFISLMLKYNKNFLVVGNLNAVTYREIFPLIMNNEIWMGATYFYGGTALFKAPKELYDPSKMSKKRNGYVDENGDFIWRVNGVRWFTNLDNAKRYKELELTKTYNEDEYQKFDNYDAININKVSDIPKDYYGVMGVPISFIDKYCPGQFKILGLMCGTRDKAFVNGNDGRTKFFMNGKSVYARILIKRK